MNYIAELDENGNVLVVLSTEEPVEAIIDAQGDRNLVPWTLKADENAYQKRWDGDDWVAAEPEHIEQIETLRAEATEE